MSAGLRIGINALFLIPGGVGGTEIYTRALIDAFSRFDKQNDYFIYRNRETQADIIPLGAAFHDRPQPLASTSRPARIAYEQTILPLAFARDRIDVVLNCGITAPLLTPLPMVTVFYDLQYTQFGVHLPVLERLATRLLFPASARRSDLLVTMTHTAERELATYFPFTRNKIVVVPHGVDPALRAVAARRSDGVVGDSFILAVSSLMAHKNFDTLLHGFAKLRRERQIRLVIVGVRGRDTARLEALCVELGLSEAVSFTGWIPRAELLELFSTASAFVFASRYEGFGIPVLEALSAGIPLACSDIPVLHEVAGEAATYFDPDDSDSITRSLRKLLDDGALREYMRIAGPARARRFDWNANVHILIEAFATVSRRGLTCAAVKVL